MRHLYRPRPVGAMQLLRRRDLAAAIPLVALVVLYLVFLATSNLIPARAMASSTLMLIGVTVLLMTDPAESAGVTWLIAILAVPATMCAVLAFILSPVLLLTISIATISSIWAVQLAEHLTVTSQEAHHDQHRSATTASR